MNKSVLTALISATTGALVGAGVTYLVVKQRLEAKYTNYANQEIEMVKRHYRMKHKEGEFSTPESTIDALHPDAPVAEKDRLKAFYEKLVEEQGYSEEEEDDVEEAESEDQTTNIFDLGVSDEEAGKPIGHILDPVETVVDSFYLNRDHRKPFVISIDEFNTTEDDFDKVSIAYYEDDDTLVDERESVITDIENIIGYDALGRFGDHSDDSNIVYVRNVDLGSDFEVLREPGEYAVRVLGLEPSKPRKQKVQKMRGDDE